jgi:hypothetical protein
VRVSIYDSYGTLLENGIDQIPFLATGEIGLAHSDTFQTSATRFLVSGVDCFHL